MKQEIDKLEARLDILLRVTFALYVAAFTLYGVSLRIESIALTNVAMFLSFVIVGLFIFGYFTDKQLLRERTDRSDTDDAAPVSSAAPALDYTYRYPSAQQRSAFLALTERETHYHDILAQVDRKHKQELQDIETQHMNERHCREVTNG